MFSEADAEAPPDSDGQVGDSPATAIGDNPATAQGAAANANNSERHGPRSFTEDNADHSRCNLTALL